MKTAELTGAALDWAVAVAAGHPVVSPSAPWRNKYGARGPAQVMVADSKRKGACHYDFRPSANWGQGGPIIERIEGFQLKIWLESKPETKCEAHIHNYEGDWINFGPTPLIAAMRCYVASKLGDEVDVPVELTTADAELL